MPDAKFSEKGKILKKSFLEKARFSNTIADYNNSFSTISSLEDNFFYGLFDCFLFA